MDTVIKEQIPIRDIAKKAWVWLQKIFPIIGFALSLLALISLFLPFATIVGIEEWTEPQTKTFSAIEYFSGITSSSYGGSIPGNVWVIPMMVFAILLIIANALAFWFELSYQKALKADPEYLAPQSWYKTVIKLVLIAAPILGFIMIFFMENHISVELSKFSSGQEYKLITPIIHWDNWIHGSVGFFIYFFSFLLLIVISLIELKYRPRGIGEIVYWLVLILGGGWIIAGLIALLNGAPE